MTDDATRPIETPMEPPPVQPPAAAAPAMDAPTGGPIADAPGATAPVAPVAATRPVAATASGGSRTRWGIAILIAGLAIAAAIGAVVLFGQQSTPVALQYIPGDAAAVAELRLDLPGDQMQHLGNLLAHFPGFADQSTLAAKLDEALTKLVESSGDTGINYQTDVKPWLAGPAFVGMLSLPSGATDNTQPDVVLSATTNGAASCTTVFKDATVSHETYKNLDIVSASDGAMACVLDGRQALIGKVENLRRAIDTKSAGSGIDRSANYEAARAALGGDRLATLYFDGAAITKLMPAPSALPVPGLEGLVGNVPAWVMGGVRAEDDALVMDYVAAPTSPSTAGASFVAVPAAHASVITPMLPGDTMAYVEVQGAGASIQNLLTQLRQVPDVDSALKMLDGIGGAGELVGWVEDIGLAVSVHGQTPDVAVLLIGKDETTVATRVASLKTLLALAGSGNGIEVKDGTVNGVPVTTVTITDAGSLIPPGTVPGMSDLPGGPLSFSLATRGKALIVTSGETAMAAVLSTAAGASLADNAAFKHAVTRGLTNPRATVYLGVGASVDLVKGFMPADAVATYQKDAAPYVEPLEGLLLQATSDAAGSRSRVVITVTKP